MEQDVFDNWPHVQKRHNKYGVRRRVPDDLRPIIGKKEITRSLGTGDPEKAKKKYHEVLAEIEAEFEAAKGVINPSDALLLTEEMAATFAESYFHDRIYQDEAYANRVRNDKSLSVDELRENVRELELNIAEDLSAVHAEGERSTAYIADAILKANGFPEVAVELLESAPRRVRNRITKRVHVDRASKGYAVLLRLSYLGQIEVFERMLAALGGPAFDTSRSMFPRLVSSITTAQAQSFQASTLNLLGANPISIEELFARYHKAHPVDPTDEKERRAKKDMDRAFWVLVELYGADTDANTLTRQNFRDLRNFLQRMPKQIGNRKKWAKKSLAEIVEETERSGLFEDDLLSPRTINSYIRRLAKVLKWGVKEPCLVRNVAEGIFVPVEDIEDDTRHPFDDGQLNLIFSSDVFTSPDREEPSIYWASLFALLHGMRSEEVLQLTVSDFQTDADGIRFVDIHRRGENSLKNKNSIRKVPIHPFLWDAGLDTLLLTAAKKASRRPLFDAERAATGRFTPVFSKRYSRYLERIGAKTKKTSFHSFRHCFRDAARNAFIPEECSSAIGGWGYGKGTQANYGSGMWMARKDEAISKITYPKVDLSKVQVIEW